ncbi:hypothetical protein C0416_03410 [bacterium]|nr:hypothetical protein [bacterium]
MKKKLLIGGGLVALVAVIVAIAVFGKGGNFFKGSLIPEFDIPEIDIPEIEVPTFSDGPNFYVNATQTCASGKALGSKECPFINIKNAFERIKTLDPAGNSSEIWTINVAQGTYSDQVSFAASGVSGKIYTIKLKGENGAVLDGGSINYTNIAGEISGFTFKPSQNASSINVGNPKTSNKVLDIYNNNFVDKWKSGESVVYLEGPGTINFKDNYFNSIGSEKSILEAKAGVFVYNNNFYKSLADSVINANNSRVFNNIITESSQLGTGNVILASNEAFIANNTLVNNYPTTNSIKNAATVKVYNNLIFDKHGTPIETGEFYLYIEGNGLEASKLSNLNVNVKNKNFACAPDFAKTGEVTSKEYYKLKSDSTCINKGKTITEVTKDAFGTDRPGDGYDIGFHELSSTFIFQQPLIDIVPYTPEEEETDTTVAPIITNAYASPEEFYPSDSEVTKMYYTLNTCAYVTVKVDETSNDTLVKTLENNVYRCTGTYNVSWNGSDSDNETVADADYTIKVSATNSNGSDSKQDDVTVNEEESIPSTPPSEVECGEWSDVSSSDSEYYIWMSLCEKGIVQGNEDGTLKPEAKLNRAELLTLAFRASQYENIYSVNNNAEKCFPDVKTQWYAKYFCTGKNKGFIQGYQDGYAKPERGVILAEGLKMFLGALDEPFDISDSDCWYCDMVEESGDDDYLPYSFTDPKQVGPIELTRRKAFNMLYRILYYR